MPNFSFQLDQIPELNLEVKQGLEQKLETRQKTELLQAQALAITSENHQSEGLGPPEDALKRLIRKVIESHMNGNVDLIGIFNDQLISSCIENSELLAIGDVNSTTKFVVKDLFKHHKYDDFQARFEITSGNDTQDFFVREVDLITAVLEPDKIKKEKEDIQNYIKEAKKDADTTGAQQRYREVTSAIEVAKHAEGFYIRPLSTAIHAAFTAGGEGDKSSPIIEFLREMVFTKRANQVISERTLKRFVNKTSGRILTSPDRYKNAFLNTIAEYILVSVGAVSADLFKLGSTGIEKDDYDDLSTYLSERGLDLKEILNNYDLKESGNIFWNRWTLTGAKKLTRETDEIVRKFITEACRNPEYKILESLGYKNFFHNLKQASQNHDQIERRTAVRQKLIDLLEREDVQKFFSRLIKEKMYPEVAKLYLVES